MIPGTGTTRQLYFNDGMYLPFGKMVKDAVDVPVMVAGRMDDPDLACQALEEGSADMIGLGRPLLADPFLPSKIRRNKAESVRPCLSCHDGCLGRLKEALPISLCGKPRLCQRSRVRHQPRRN